MEGSISNIEEKNDILKFTLSNIDVSTANAIRRTILMDIPLVVFKNTSVKRPAPLPTSRTFSFEIIEGFHFVDL